MLRFLYVVLSKRNSDSSTDQGETASVERPFAADHLQNTVGLGNKRGGERNKRFILFVSFDAW
jgi:hypothetical protein